MTGQISRIPQQPDPPSLQRSDRPLSVLLLNYELAPIGGGAGNATQKTARQLAKRGHVVHVLTSRLRGQPAVATENGVVVWRVPSFRTSMLECGLLGAASYVCCAFVQLVRLARRYEYDVYQFYFGLPTGLLAFYVHLFLRKPYSIALRGSDVPGYDDTGWYMAPLHRLLRPLSRSLWRNAGAVTVLSEGLGDLARNTLPDGEFELIPNGVDEAEFPKRPASIRNPRLRLVTVCRMVSRKGLQYLIAAMEELQHDGVELWLIGSGQQQAQIARLVRERKLDSCVWMPGYVARHRLHMFYQQADVFVLPSLSESFGQVLLEAMSTGLPVVATSVGGIPEVVSDERGGILVPPADPDAIIDAVKALSAAPERRVKMGEYNASRARARYSWRAVAIRYEILYRRMLGEDVPMPIDETGRMRQI